MLKCSNWALYLPYLASRYEVLYRTSVEYEIIKFLLKFNFDLFVSQGGYSVRIDLGKLNLNHSDSFLDFTFDGTIWHIGSRPY